MENTKRVFLITLKQRKPYHIQNLKARYKEQITFVDHMEEADFVLCIGVKESTNPDILKAEEMGIQISYFTEEMLPERNIQNALCMTAVRQVGKDEITFLGEELE